MNTEFQPIIQSKETERRRLGSLPWSEKLELLDKLCDRHLMLRGTRPKLTDLAKVPK